MKISPAELDWRDVHEVMLGVIIPRPIAFVSTVSADGINNVAPFSNFVSVCQKPTLVGIAISSKRDGGRKDTINNIEATGEFVVNLVDEVLKERMNQSSYPYPPDVDEFKECGLTPVKADLVKAPMLEESPVHMECRVHQILAFGPPTRLTHFVIGEVLLVHIRDEFYADGKILVPELKTIARLGGDYYCRITDMFVMDRPYTVG